MLEANVVTTSLPFVLANSSSNAATTSNSEPVKPGRSTFVLSARQRQHAARTQFGEPVEVEVLAVERRLVDLEVARVDHRSDRRPIATASASGMLCVTRRNSIVRAPTVTRSRGVTGTRRPASSMPCRSSFGPDQRQRQRRSVDRPVHVREDVRDGADVILVAVREHERRRLRRALLQVREVRDDQVDAQQFGVGEHHAGVDQDERVAPRHGHHVHAELAEPAERDDLERGHAESGGPA